MKCLDCHEDLIEVPTSHGPGLDVCFSGHGLWLDVGEVNFFVEDYTSLKRAMDDTGGVAVRTETLCPRCGKYMESETVSHTSFLNCDSCRGWWLPHGSLTHLNETYRGAAVPIQLHEAELYTRAATRHRALNDTVRRQHRVKKQRSTLKACGSGSCFSASPSHRRDHLRRWGRQNHENHSVEPSTGSTPFALGSLVSSEDSDSSSTDGWFTNGSA